MTESWEEGLHPCTKLITSSFTHSIDKPIIRDGKLYGRGGADDGVINLLPLLLITQGYAIFASLLSVKALQLQNVPHGRVVALIEASEESGSIHLFPYVDHLADRIGVPCLAHSIHLNARFPRWSSVWTLDVVITSDSGFLMTWLRLF